MDQTTFDRLEFPGVLEHLARFAVSPAARKAVRETRPWTDVETIGYHATAVQEVLGLLDRGRGLEIGGFDDCSAILERLTAPNHTIEPEQWMALRNFIAVGRRVARSIHGSREIMPVCQRRAEAIDPLIDFDREIERVFDADGLVRDSASPTLKDIRQAMRRLEREIEKVYARLLSSLTNAGILQDGYVSVRDGRRVLPVKVNQQSRVPGIVHDTSRTGETLFVEPMEAVQPSNRLAAEQNREREEILLILRELANRARQEMPVLEANRDALVQIDLWHARASLANRHNLHRPDVESAAVLHLIEAHHPLLYFNDARRSVPLSIRLEPDNRVLVITGPNTGGKTTALKTIGLTALMAQSAIPVPAGVDSRLPLFQQVLAEMGDEQSVAAGLSTFSAHIRRISWILEHCAGNALVLLDELGKATDPVQAGALGRAILEALTERGALTLVTTHLPRLKDWAHDSPAGRNASFRLDPRTHRPRYQIHLDTPGISEAFTIARAEGLPDEIVDAAAEHLPRDERELIELLESLHHKEAHLDRERRRMHSARERADRQRLELHRVHRDLEKERATARKKYESEYKALLEEARDNIEKRIANLPSRRAMSDARERIRKEQAEAEERLSAVDRRERELLESAESAKKKPEKIVDDGPFEPEEGDWAKVGDTGAPGRVRRLDKGRGRAVVDVRGLEIDAKIVDLRRAEAPPEPTRKMSVSRYAGDGPVAAVQPEIELIGQRVEEALRNLDDYLDRAVLSHLSQVRVVHGHGTGALRSAVHEFLRGHPHAANFRFADVEQGGSAATMVTLR